MNYLIFKIDFKRNVWDLLKELVVCLIEDKSGNCLLEVQIIERIGLICVKEMRQIGINLMDLLVLVGRKENFVVEKFFFVFMIQF